MSSEQRLVILELVLLGLAFLIWVLFTDGTSGSLRATLFWIGLGSIVFGIALISGAWRGYREQDTDYIIGPSLERSAKAFKDVKRAYSDLNMFALAGCITIVLSVII